MSGTGLPWRVVLVLVSSEGSYWFWSPMKGGTVGAGLQWRVVLVLVSSVRLHCCWPPAEGLTNVNGETFIFSAGLSW